MMLPSANTSGAYAVGAPLMEEGQSLYRAALAQMASEPDIIRNAIESMISHHLQRRQIDAVGQQNRGIGGKIGGGLGMLGGALMGIPGGAAGMAAGAALGGQFGGVTGSLFDPAPVSPAQFNALGNFAASPIYRGNPYTMAEERSHNYPAGATPPINPGY